MAVIVRTSWDERQQAMLSQPHGLMHMQSMGATAGSDGAREWAGAEATNEYPIKNQARTRLHCSTRANLAANVCAAERLVPLHTAAQKRCKRLESATTTPSAPPNHNHPPL